MDEKTQLTTTNIENTLIKVEHQRKRIKMGMFAFNGKKKKDLVRRLRVLSDRSKRLELATSSDGQKKEAST